MIRALCARCGWAILTAAILAIGANALNGVVAAGDHGGKRDFEVWIADQSDTRAGFGGQLLIYEGSDLMRRAAAEAQPIVRLDLGAETADLCRARTGRNPVRPHMILFNTE